MTTTTETTRAANKSPDAKVMKLAQKIADAVVRGIAFVDDEHIIEREVFGDSVALESKERRIIDAAVQAATRAAWQAAAVAAALAQKALP